MKWDGESAPVRTGRDDLPALLFVVAPHEPEAPASVHCSPDEAVGAATREPDGCRVLVVHPATGRWKEAEVSQPFDADDPTHERETQVVELSGLGQELMADS